MIRPDWVCHCHGVGEDITLDLGLIDRFACTLFAFDATPRAITYVAENVANEPKFHFMPVGLWSDDTTLKSYALAIPAHVSQSVADPQDTQPHVDGPASASDH